MANSKKSTPTRSQARQLLGELGGRAREVLTVPNLLSIPSNPAMLRRFIGSVNGKLAQEEIEGELQRKVAILGLANSGKSTLFNTLRGQYASPVSATAGTTKSLVRGSFGPFMLIDTPGHLPDLQQAGMDEAA